MYCCQAIRERQFRDCKAFQVTSKNREFDKKVLEVCGKKNDALGISVKGTTRFTTDLHAADAVYHTTCDWSFGTGTVKRESCITRLRKIVVSDRENVFQQMIEYLCANVEKQITLNDLKELMDSFLKDSPHEAFTTKWMKHKCKRNWKMRLW